MCRGAGAGASNGVFVSLYMHVCCASPAQRVPLVVRKVGPVDCAVTPVAAPV